MAGNAGAIRAGRAFIELFLDDSKTKASLASLQRQFSSVGASLKAVKLGGVLIGAGTALAAPLGVAFKQAIEFNKVLKRFNLTFGELADGQRKWIDELASGIGRSKKEVLDFAAQFQNVTLSVGLDPGRAAEASQTLTKLAFDLAALKGKDVEEVLSDLSRGFRGAERSVFQYGINISKAAVAQKLFAEGLNPKTATTAEKALARLSLIVDATKNSHGAAERAAGGFGGSLRRLKVIQEELSVSIGNAILPTVVAFTKRIVDLIPRLDDWIAKNPALVQGVAALSIGLIAMGATLVTLGSSFAALATAAGALATVIGTIGAPLAAVIVLAGVGIAAFVDWDEAAGRVSVAIQGIKAVLTDVIALIGSGQIAKAFELAVIPIKQKVLEIEESIARVTGPIFGLNTADESRQGFDELTARRQQIRAELQIAEEEAAAKKTAADVTKKAESEKEQKTGIAEEVEKTKQEIKAEAAAAKEKAKVEKELARAAKREDQEFEKNLAAQNKATQEAIANAKRLKKEDARDAKEAAVNFSLADGGSRFAFSGITRAFEEFGSKAKDEAKRQTELAQRQLDEQKQTNRILAKQGRELAFR